MNQILVYLRVKMSSKSFWYGSKGFQLAVLWVIGRELDIIAQEKSLKEKSVFEKLDIILLIIINFLFEINIENCSMDNSNTL